MGFMKKLMCISKKKKKSGEKAVKSAASRFFLLRVPVIRISGFRSTKESKNSLLNSFDHDILNEASSNFVSKNSPVDITFLPVYLFTRFFF